MTIDINDIQQIKKDLLGLSENIVEASLYWTGEDEEKNPKLKRIRTLAGFYKDRYKT